MENKKSKDIKNYLAVSLLSAVLLSSCTHSTTRNSIYSNIPVSQERTFNTITDDLAIKNNIKQQLAKTKMFTSVGVKVIDGRVLLTGKVLTQTDRLEAVKIAWQQPGVNEINNEIIVTRNPQESAPQIAKDSWITSEIRTKLLATRKIKSINYGFETIDGVVYVLGIAQNQKELKKVINIAINTKDVRKVVSYVRLKY
jgi:osmotically-inducible protein OsmY